MLRLPGIFKEHAVLQRDREIKIWGESSEEMVYISIENGSDKELCKLNSEVSEGKFVFRIGPYSAGGPYRVRIWNEGKDEEIVLGDVYFGDVYIAGGQSNMELELQNSRDGKEEVEKSSDPHIRFYYTPKVAWVGEELEEAERKSVWEKCEPGKTACWSAVGYYFAKALSEELNGRDDSLWPDNGDDSRVQSDSGENALTKPDSGVMIGIIGCNWGGTSASAWMSREKLLEYPETAAYVESYDKKTEGQSLDEYLKELEEYEVYQAEFDKNVGNYYMTAENPSWDEAIRLFGENRYPGPMGPRNWTRPAGLYESMLKRIAPYGICGVLWYQGEDDDNRPYTYKRLLTSLTEQWKADFENPELPFYIVQLPRFVNEGEEDDKNWPFLREAQSDVCNENEGFGLAVILESGEYHNIHPLNKETVGYRLAFQALYRYYGLYGEWDACGPSLKSSFIEGDSVYSELACCESGLVTDGDDGFLEDVYLNDYLPGDSGFEIAGDDGVYYPARAQYVRYESSASVESPKVRRSLASDGQNEAYDDENYSSIYDDYPEEEELTGGTATLKITSDKVSVPKYARYFWKNYGKVRIFGANGIPLAPFRTSRDDGARAAGSRQGMILDSTDI
ncbi:MAG: hypothetical protein IJ796_06180 [Lachnospiraceae bacterium]|nr:hypothetical protein [Lachnospiraceae bacterium]